MRRITALRFGSKCSFAPCKLRFFAETHLVLHAPENFSTACHVAVEKLLRTVLICIAPCPLTRLHLMFSIAAPRTSCVTRFWNVLRQPASAVPNLSEMQLPQRLGRRALLGGDPFGRTGHTGTAQSAIAARIFRQVLLMIILGEIKRRGRNNFAADRTITGR
jgi:hypothetical protein